MIKPLIGKKISILSGGETRFLELLLVSYSDAKYILIDEPFSGIAPLYKDEIKKIIKDLSKTKGFIITDHDYHNTLDISTRIILLHDGGTKQISNKQEIVDWNYLPFV